MVFGKCLLWSRLLGSDERVSELRTADQLLPKHSQYAKDVAIDLHRARVKYAGHTRLQRCPVSEGRVEGVDGRSNARSIFPILVLGHSHVKLELMSSLSK
jgi:hypothetical protein